MTKITNALAGIILGFSPIVNSLDVAGEDSKVEAGASQEGAYQTISDLERKLGELTKLTRITNTPGIENIVVPISPTEFLVEEGGSSIINKLTLTGKENKRDPYLDLRKYGDLSPGAFLPIGEGIALSVTKYEKNNTHTKFGVVYPNGQFVEGPKELQPIPNGFVFVRGYKNGQLHLSVDGEYKVWNPKSGEVKVIPYFRGIDQLVPKGQTSNINQVEVERELLEGIREVSEKGNLVSRVKTYLTETIDVNPKHVFYVEQEGGQVKVIFGSYYQPLTSISRAMMEGSEPRYDAFMTTIPINALPSGLNQSPPSNNGQKSNDKQSYNRNGQLENRMITLLGGIPFYVAIKPKVAQPRYF